MPTHSRPQLRSKKTSIIVLDDRGSDELPASIVQCFIQNTMYGRGLLAGYGLTSPARKSRRTVVQELTEGPRLCEQLNDLHLEIVVFISILQQFPEYCGTLMFALLFTQPDGKNEASFLHLENVSLHRRPQAGVYTARMQGQVRLPSFALFALERASGSSAKELKAGTKITLYARAPFGLNAPDWKHSHKMTPILERAYAPSLASHSRIGITAGITVWPHCPLADTSETHTVNHPSSNAPYWFKFCTTIVGA
ncbi:unnamed protein product [Rhizoctonia solani]|uniref:Uncharacterized protein n=1 Tax=Rhizoctonia solani TaxID=456999 RepID=A0A8H3CGI0_9AGAM|nr:unnamed protein product [Rhizoctonia solani]